MNDVNDLLTIYKIVANNPEYFSPAFRDELINNLAMKLKRPHVFSLTPVATSTKIEGKYAYLHGLILRDKPNDIDYDSPISIKIKVIKKFREQTGEGLKYAKDYVEWVWGYPNTFEPRS